MAKVTEYPRITKLKDNDIFLVDGPDGTRTILQKDASKLMGGEVIMVNETAGDATKVIVNTTDEEVQLATMEDLEPVAENVRDLKGLLNNISGNEFIENFTATRYVNTSGDYININSMTSSGVYDCKVIDCAPGDIFTITGYGGTPANLLYVFAGAETTVDGNVVRPALLKSQANLNETDLIITAPANAEKLIINVRRSTPYYVCTNAIVKKSLKLAFEAIDDLDSKIDQETEYLRVGNPLFDVITVTDGAYISAGDNAYGNIVNSAFSNYTDYIPVVPNTVIKVEKAYTYGNRGILAYDSDKKPLRPALATNSGVAGITTEIITIPKLARYIRITGKVSDGAPVCSYLSIARDGTEADYSLICDTATDGNYVSSVSGGTPGDANACCTAKIRVRPYAHVKCENLYLTGNRSVCAYKKDQTFLRPLISGSSSESAEFDITPDIYYIRATGHAGTPPLIYMSEPTISDTERLYHDVNILIPYDFNFYTQDKIVTYIDDDAVNETGLGYLKTACDELSETNDISVKCSIAAVGKILESTSSRVTFLKGLEDEGFHICNHTYSHTRWYEEEDDQPIFTLAEMEEDLIKSIRVFDELGFIDAARFLVYPGSSFATAGLPQMVRKWVDIACTIRAGNNYPGNNIPQFLYRCPINGNTEKMSTVNYYANQLEELEKSGHNWIIYYSHCKNYTPDPVTGRSEWSAALFKGVMQNAVDRGYKVMTLNEAWKYRRAEYDVQAAFGV